MGIFFEILSILWQTVSGLVSGFATAIWNNLPAILEIKKIMGYFTPVGMVALYLGVPTALISLLYALLKKIYLGRFR